ncbi:MAG TPA: rhomboid family intramembrane serine protease [Micromonosporaceae bacterium]|jgi:membrane associated rhomboid family serine protease|nr:rhomboid family intramembrane serine protease [Micromonosporaceae bacterium]
MTATRPPQSSDPDEFGTVEFYASIGRGLVAMSGVIVGLFAIELINWLTHQRLNAEGAIVTRVPSGLDGILFAPLLHASWSHLYANSVPLLLTGTFVLAGGTTRFLTVTAFVALVSGLTVWFVGGPTGQPTVGASGVIFGYIGYLLMRGIVERTWWTIGVAALVGLLYGVAISGVVPGDPRVSWQGHLGGFVAGLLAAVLLRNRRVRPPTEPTKLPSTLTLPTLD